MRKILFRGKRIDNDEWLYGNLVRTEYALGPDRFEIVGFFTGECYFSHEVYPDTVGQFTGFRDKNDKRIFEGDIVKVKYYSCGEDCEEITAVRNDEQTGGFSPFTWQYECDGCDCETSINEIEVLGNLWDNPELLSKEEAT